MESELRKIGKYDILSILGKGAMGTIYKGIDPVIQRHVAIKTINKQIPSAEQQPLKERFIREAQAAGRLQHVNIVGIYEYGEDAEQAFIAMEFIEGVTLTDKLQAHTQFTIPEISNIMSKVLDALGYAHSMGVVHRDIKPGNIILTDAGEVKVTDFGIARLESSTMTQIGTILGTPGYMSPEQLVGEHVDSRSDIFSAGALLYELLTGEKAFGGSTFTSVMYKILNADPVAPASLCPTVPAAFDAIVGKALAKKPEDRFQTAKAFSDAIAGIKQDPSRAAVQASRLPDEEPLAEAKEPQAPATVVIAGKIKPDSVPLQEDTDATRITPPPTLKGGGNKAYIFGGILIFVIAIAAGYPVWQSIIEKRDVDATAPSAAGEESALSRETEQADTTAEKESPLARETEQSDSADNYEPGQRLRDCETCPELVVVPPGSFTRGSPDSEKERQISEGPQQIAEIGYPLAIGRYEVTLDEFEEFNKETGYRSSGCTIYEGDWLDKKESSWNNPGFKQTGRHPATCIAWSDAQAYIKWLSDKTNRTYRLLSSSEWEYIARSGIQTSRSWGDDADKACSYANVADSFAEEKYKGWKVHNCKDNFVYTAPVGSFEPNNFAVYDMLGNVFEWVEDCWNKDYQGAPTDGTSWSSGDCDQRVLRGGSWFSRPRFVRLAFRNRFSPDYRSSTFGFRVARVLE